MSRQTRENVESLIDFPDQLTPYYNENHKQYRLYVRECFNKLIKKYYNDADPPKTTSKEFLKKLAKYGGVYSFPFGYGNWNNVKWDPFYTIIFSYETNYMQAGLGSNIHFICLPPIIAFGKNEIHKRVINQVKSGDKFISLAISELTGGSDVANLKTTAIKDGNGNYIINGNKYWITGGCRAGTHKYIIYCFYIL